MDKWMAYLQETKFGNLSDNDRVTADRQIVMQTEGTRNIDCDETARRATGGEIQPTRAKQRLVQAQLWVRRVCGPEPRLVWT